MNSADHHLLSKVNQNTKLIFWLTPKALTPALDGFKAADYLTNGLITHTLRLNPVIEDHMFVSTNFNQPLYIYFSTSIDVHLKSINDVIKTNLAESDIYLVWGDKKMNDEFVKALPQEWKERCLDI